MHLLSVEARPDGGVLRTFADENGTIVEQYMANVEPVLDENKRAKNGDQPKHWLTAPDEFEGELIARIPVDIALLWKTKYGVDVMNKEDEPRVMALLNDSDWMYLKTTWKSL